MTNIDPRSDDPQQDDEIKNFEDAWQYASDVEKETLHSFARDSYERELNLLWQRTQFFWTINAVAIGGLGFFANHDPSIQYSDYALILSSFGLITSLCWTLINRGSKYWYEQWEDRLKLQGKYKPWMKPYPKQSSSWLLRIWSARFSPSKVLIAISDIVSFFWLFMTVTMVMEWGFNRFWYLLVTLFAILYIFRLASWHSKD